MIEGEGMVKDRRRSRRKKKRWIPAAGEKESERSSGTGGARRGTEGQYGLAYYLRATSLSHRGEDPRIESAKL